jgi:hypothetical protein
MEDYYRHDPTSDNDNDNENEEYISNPEIELENIEEQLKILWDNILNPYVSSNSKEILHKVQEYDFHFLWNFFLDNNKEGKKLLTEIYN